VIDVRMYIMHSVLYVVVSLLIFPFF